ncbi:PREDICTED: mitogen-activated protein kinase kinase kinase YODA-like [Ipomoea nil]|uniref:mitogen-activated protein kinase kinase kinase YODA-like n=1 Tax=Ipomoea nil TaxID=35883 RepID=UPI000901D9C9|nr:PREDICTED: mitogen-activated protein kinase kinase kinase YODA-like [Ipomoea nil]
MAKKLNVERSWVRERCIGKGSFATVSLARNGGGVFAVKSVDVASCSPSQVEALENEIRVLRRISSPYVVKYLGDDSTWEAAAAYRNLHLEYLPGGTVADLAQRRGGGDVDEAVVRSYARCLVEALRYIHAKGIVHCDVKGQNVLVGPAAGLAKLADFGTAVEIGSGRRPDKAAPPRGSPLWMAPEVIRGEYQGPESDVWSLGCTVIEMITGKWPWEDRGAADTLCRIGYSDELPQLPTQSSELCRDFLSKCLQRDLKKRWSSDQLLRHPFVSLFPPPDSVAVAAFPSPRCVLDWFNSDSDSDTEDSGETVNFSAKERIGKLASGINSDWEGTAGGWVVVREGTSSEYPNFLRTEGESISSEYSDSTAIFVAEPTSTSGSKECLNSEIHGDSYCQQTSSHRSRMLHRAARGDDEFHVYICSKIILLMTLLITVYYTCFTNCILPCFYHIYKKSLFRTQQLHTIFNFRFCRLLSHLYLIYIGPSRPEITNLSTVSIIPYIIMYICTEKNISVPTI